ncbi:MAG: MarR family transcriptional regulator [Candidatus Thermoplasmatota archaeon]|jgi:predicted transcriptional regulator|nr:MarR family transcriptional regulator [Candidatus Thermoplasmatota archaeon]MCL5799970.1 MarR family transcriptional regulator [Candidatus Thermoplasmatota archaeon]
MDSTFAYPGLPNSSRYVIRVLRDLKVATIESIQDETGLSRRTIMYALHELKERGLVFVQICLNDSRRRYYCYSAFNDI